MVLASTQFLIFSYIFMLRYLNFIVKYIVQPYGECEMCYWTNFDNCFNGFGRSKVNLLFNVQSKLLYMVLVG